MVSLKEYRDDYQLAQAINEFFVRFDAHDFRNIICEQKRSLSGNRPNWDVDQDAINMFKHSKARKNPGPDNIEDRLLISSAQQLGSIFLSYLSTVPHSNRRCRDYGKPPLIPVAKNNHPVVLNDFRPVALTSLVMKSFERLLKKEHLIKVEDSFDPLQFAYWAKRGFQYRKT